MKLKEKYRAFKQWQRQPHQVAPLSQEEHTCSTCGTVFHGNYCPRCGQSKLIGRYSLKTTALLFLDVWGLGNRSMFRTLRDLLFRPGYMIRDYLGGMQMAYFPPFKMFFILIAISVLVSSGFNIKGQNLMTYSQESFEIALHDATNIEEATANPDATNKQEATANPDATNKQEAAADPMVTQQDTVGPMVTQQDTVASSSLTPEEIQRVKSLERDAIEFSNAVFSYINRHQTLVVLLWLLVFSLPMFLFFRHCPAIPDLRYSEFFVAMTYTTNLMSVISIVLGFFCVGTTIISLIAFAMGVVALKQLSGYSYLRTFFSLLAVLLIICVAMILLIFLIVAIFAL